MATKKRGTGTKTRQAGGMFAEFEPAAPKPAAETAPMFEVPADARAAVRPDYGRAVAPVRETAPAPLFGVTLAVDESTGTIGFGLDL